jgi:predicted metal-dependent phosphoesterase TrpH
MIKTDLHVHTKYSHDSFLNFKTLENLYLKKGINCLAITDHNEIEGALRFKEYTQKIKVIIGEEVFTTHGEIIGLFLNEKIPAGLSPEETVFRIKNQGGLVYIPHPFDYDRRKSILEFDKIKELIDDIDIIEVFNSRTRNQIYNDNALELAIETNKIKAVGSDAHTFLELGRSYQELADFQNTEQFLANLNEANLSFEPSPKLVHYHTKVGKRVKKYLFKRDWIKDGLLRTKHKGYRREI